MQNIIPGLHQGTLTGEIASSCCEIYMHVCLSKLLTYQVLGMPCSRSTSARVVKSYKTFMLELPDEITPEEAQKKYDEYLTVFWGSARKSHFQSIKDKPE